MHPNPVRRDTRDPEPIEEQGPTAGLGFQGFQPDRSRLDDDPRPGMSRSRCDHREREGSIIPRSRDGDLTGRPGMPTRHDEPDPIGPSGLEPGRKDEQGLTLTAGSPA